MRALEQEISWLAYTTTKMWANSKQPPKMASCDIPLFFPKPKAQWVVKKVQNDGSSAELLEEVHATKVTMLNKGVPERIRNYSLPEDIPRNIAGKEVPDKDIAISKHVSRMKK